MNVRSTLITMGVAVVCVVVATFVHRLDARAAATRVNAAPFLSEADLPVDDVNRIVVSREGEPRLEFELGPDGWMQVEPFPFQMDPFSIRSIVTAARDLIVAQRLDLDSGDLDAAIVGLEPARARLRYEWPNGSLDLDLGRRGVGGRGYVRRSGDPSVAVVGVVLHDRVLAMDPREWRDRRIFRHAGIDSQFVEQQTGDLVIRLERERRRWHITDPIPTRLDRAVEGEFFDALGRARSSGFVSDDPAELGRFGLDPPVAALTVVSSRLGTGDAEPSAVVERLLIGAPSGDRRYAMVEGMPAVVLLNAAVVDAFFRPLEEIVDPIATGVRPSDVRRVLISTDEGDFDLERDLERWVERESGADADPGAVETLMQMLTEVRASRIVIVPEYPRDIEFAIVTLFGYDGGPLDTVRILRDDTTRDWALENGDNVLRLHGDNVAFPLSAEALGL